MAQKRSFEGNCEIFRGIFSEYDNYSRRALWIWKNKFTNEVRLAELVMIISYPANPSRINCFIKNHIIENLKES